MRGVRFILIVAYLAATIGLPENLGLTSSDCRCGSGLQQDGQCCCAASGKASGNCCGKAQANIKAVKSSADDSSGNSQCSKCDSAGSSEPRVATCEKPTRSCCTKVSSSCPPDGKNECVPFGQFTSRCGCGSSVPGSFTVDDPRLVAAGSTIIGRPVSADYDPKSVVMPVTILMPPDTPPPQAA